MLRPTIAILAVASLAVAQSSSDPLAGVPTGTPVFNPSVTYTITSTYEQAGSRVPTTLIGSVGPSTFSAGSFSYDKPVSVVPATYPSALYESLASQGLPTDATQALQAPLGNLQIVNDGAMEMGVATGLALGAAVIAGAGIMFF